MIVVVGNVQAQEAFDLAEGHFGARRAAAGPFVPLAPPTGRGKQHLMRKVAFDVPLVVVGYPAPPSSMPTPRRSESCSWRSRAAKRDGCTAKSCGGSRWQL